MKHAIETCKGQTACCFPRNAVMKRSVKGAVKLNVVFNITTC